MMEYSSSLVSVLLNSHTIPPGLLTLQLELIESL